jgi:hypothetical protein
MPSPDHTYSPCLGERLGDDGSKHRFDSIFLPATCHLLGDDFTCCDTLPSPLHGFSFDGYPIYGPYHADGTLVVSCWQVRVHISRWL